MPQTTTAQIEEPLENEVIEAACISRSELISLLNRLVEKSADNLETGDPALNEVLRRIEQKLSSGEKLAERVLIGTQSIARQSGYLQTHSRNATNIQADIIGEIGSRSNEMVNALNFTREHVRASVDATARLMDELNSTFTDVMDIVSAQLVKVETQLDGKAENVHTIMEEIQSIGFHLNLLSLNATVEAAHAGESGRGFAIVAQEVRGLAGSATEHSRGVAKHLDLVQVQKDMEGLTNELNKALSATRSKIETAITDLHRRFEEMDTRLLRMESINNVLMEFLDISDSSLRHALTKSKRASVVLETILALPPTPQQATQQLYNALRELQIINPNGLDQLNKIQQRGVLRVAVEPTFIGLSFRSRSGEPLRGLDIEYAQAFAKWLNVDCEFIEYPWDVITELLVSGKAAGEPPADLICSALPPSADYDNIAYSEAYTYLHFALVRRAGNLEIENICDLDGKVLGIINDPGAKIVLEELGIRWQTNASKAGGKIRLANLLVYNDQSKIQDAVATGIVDAFAVDLPIFYWACNNPDSPWYQKIEMLPGNIAANPYYYTMAVLAQPSSYTLLREINKFIAWFKAQPQRQKLENLWQGSVVDHTISYRDEPGNLIGEQELGTIFAA